MKDSHAKSAMVGKKSSKKRKVKEMHIRAGKSGGFIVRHDLHPKSKKDEMDAMMSGAGADQNTEEHVVPDMPALQQHMADNSPVPDMEQEEPDSNGAPTTGGM